VRELVSEVKFACPNGCGELLKLAEFKGHQGECLEEVVVCRAYRECKGRGRRKGMGEHL
jgi:hypothetical protein